MQEQARGKHFNSGLDYNNFYKAFIERIKADGDAGIKTGDLYAADLKIKD